MTFSPAWDAKYSNTNGAGGIEARLLWLLRMYVGDPLTGQRILEFGSGCGANIPALRNLGADYWGIEGSRAAVDRIDARIPEISGKVWCGDFTKPHPLGSEFDILIDRASIAHNDAAGVIAATENVWASLKPGGLFVSSDWFSIAHSEFGCGELVDSRTFTDYPDGQFVGVGRVHFSDEQELKRLFSKFEPAMLVERITRRPAPGFVPPGIQREPWISRRFDDVDYHSAVWDIVVRKPR